MLQSSPPLGLVFKHRVEDALPGGSSQALVLCLGGRAIKPTRPCLATGCSRLLGKRRHVPAKPGGGTQGNPFGWRCQPQTPLRASRAKGSLGRRGAASPWAQERPGWDKG